MGELERGKARVLCVKIKRLVWGLLFGARLLKKKARTSKDNRFQGKTQTLDFCK